MNTRNQQNSQQNLLGAIESAVERKHHELSSEDDVKVSEQMVELFFLNQGVYFLKEEIFPSLKSLFGNDTVYDRVGPKGRDEILSVLKAKSVIKEYWAVEGQIKYHKDGRLKSSGELVDPSDMRNDSGRDEIEGKIKVYRYITKDEAEQN